MIKLFVHFIGETEVEEYITVMRIQLRCSIVRLYGFRKLIQFEPGQPKVIVDFCSFRKYVQYLAVEVDSPG